MKEEKFRIITIGRQLGCGGSQIGHEAARRLGLECYDKRLIEMACSYGEVDMERMRAVDEKMPNPFLYSVPREIQNEKTGRGIAVNDMMFNLQSEVIRRLAARESCVIIGRSADYILKEHKPILRIFIYSPDEVRIKNVMESHNLSEDDAKLFIMEKDKRYHKRHMALTGSNRGDRHNRDMLIDSSLLGVDGTAELIESVAKKVFHE